MVIKKIYFLLLLVIVFSCSTGKDLFRRDDSFNAGIKTPEDCIKKHGMPDFKYHDLSTNEVWAYNDSIKGAVHSFTFAENQYLGYSWSRYFTLPDTTETIVHEVTPPIPTPLTLSTNQCIVRHTNGYGVESFIQFNLEDSIGTITQGGKSENVNVTPLKSALMKYPVYHIGSIKKKHTGPFFHVGSVQLWVKENDTIYYSSMIALNWYDQRFETVMQGIWKLV